MVIKQDSSGKYYIAPSPASFYKSKTPSSSSGSSSSSGGSSQQPQQNNFLKIIEDSKAEGEAKLSVIAPNYNTGRITGGSSSSSSSGSSSSSSSGSSNAQTISGAVSMNQANVNVANYEQGQNTLNTLGVASTSNVVVDKWYSNQQSKTGSYGDLPNVQTIKREEEKGNINPQTALSGMGIYYNQQYQKQYATASKENYKNILEDELKIRNTANQYYQGRIDKGEDYNTVSSEFTNYLGERDLKLGQNQLAFNKNWESTVGEKYKAGANRNLFDQSLLYETQRKQQAVLPTFLKGAGTGAVTTTGFMALQKVAPKIASFGAKVIATPLMIGYGAYSIGTSGYSAKKGYEQSKALGFTETQARQRSLLIGTNALSGPAFYSAGAVVGGLTVAGGVRAYQNLRTTGRVMGYSQMETQRLSKLLGRKNALKIDLQKGTVKDLKVKSGGVTKTGGVTARTYNVKLNTQGLSGKNLATANKYNLRGTVSQKITGTGKKFSGFETGSFKTGGVLGRTTTTFTTIKGATSGSKIRGFTSSLSQTGRIYEVSSGAFSGKGAVKYPNPMARLEGSSVNSRTIFKATYVQDPKSLIQFGTPGGKIISYSTTPGPMRTNIMGIGSKLTGNINFPFATNNIMGVGNVKTYGDVVQFKGSGVTNKPAFTFDGTPTSTAGTSSSGGGSRSFRNIGGGQQTVTTTSTIKINPLPPTTNINAPSTFQSSAGQGFVSAYAGTGQYELTTAPGLSGGSGPQVNIISPQSLTPQVKLIGLQGTVKPMGSSSAKQRTIQPIIFNPIVTPSPIQATPIQQPATKQTPRTRLINPTIQQPALLNPGILTGGSGGIYSSPPIPTVRTPFIPIIPFGSLGGWRQAGSGRARARPSPKGYNPSLTASFFKITGSKPKGVKTGISFRPIIKVKKKKKRKGLLW